MHQPSHLITRLALPLMALLFSVCSYAQNGLEIQQQASAIKCLTPAKNDRGTPTYPDNSLKMKEGARVLVQLIFESAQEPPVAKILQLKGESEFADSVREFVKQYRLPCLLPSDKPVQANQEFVFAPVDEKTANYGPFNVWSPPPIPKTCFSLPSGRPTYPRNALQKGEGGTLLAQFTFDQPNEVPKISVLYDAHSPHLKRSVMEYIEKYRFVCPLPNGKPVELYQTFDFSFEGATRFVFPDIGLKDFLAMVDPVDLINAKFDTSNMSCPFDLSVSLRKPYVSNVVAEIGESDPDRGLFIEWIKQLTIRFPRESEPYLFDKSIKVSVPCMKLEL